MRKPGFTKIEAIVVICIIVILAALLFPVFARTRCNENRFSCQSNLRQLGIAIELYTADYDNIYPVNRQQEYQTRATKSDNASGWAQDLKPYLGNPKPYHCPTRQNLTPASSGYTDYYFNDRLASLDSKRAIRHASVIQLGEGNDGNNLPTAGYAYSELPKQWRDDKNSPAYRHYDGANYGFADGHVKWLRPENITDEKPNGKNFTFVVR